VMIACVRSDDGAVGVDGHCRERSARAVDEVAGEETERHVGATSKRVQKIRNSRKRFRGVSRVAQLLPQALDVANEQPLESRVDVRVVVTDVAHQLADDLRISLSVES